MEKTAIISDCGTFRYHLARRWGAGRPMMFIMLNPSTADADIDDPTIRKCIGFAERNGCEAIEVVNLFAYRATDPRELARAGYLAGPLNLEYVTRTANRTQDAAGIIVCAWGANARGLYQALDIRARLTTIGHELHALKLLADGTPAHPLMLPYSSKLACISGAQSREVA
ncbi:hypothetical protein AU476_07420 [Cupriavidus sp. UYMSc13B]|nr:hypothetical protein AU476_07420 [Cupriavidus sp. UYMSc13B]